MSHVGSQDECVFAISDAVAYVVAAVVGYFKGCHLHVAYHERHILDNLAVCAVYLVGHVVVAVHAVEDGGGGIYGYAHLFAQVSGGLDVVGMVVGDEECDDALKRYAALFQCLFYLVKTT